MIGSSGGMIYVECIIDIGGQVVTKFFALVGEYCVRDAEKIDPTQGSISDRWG